MFLLTSFWLIRRTVTSSRSAWTSVRAGRAGHRAQQPGAVRNEGDTRPGHGHLFSKYVLAVVFQNNGSESYLVGKPHCLHSFVSWWSAAYIHVLTIACTYMQRRNDFFCCYVTGFSRQKAHLRVTVSHTSAARSQGSSPAPGAECRWTRASCAAVTELR